MKKLVYLILIISHHSYCQNNYEEVERGLWSQFNSRKIDSEEWYTALMRDAGSLGVDFSAWFISIDSISDHSENQIKLFFKNSYQIEEDNGNQYARMVLENHTNHAIEIHRIDATIDNLQEYFFIENDWVEGRKNGQSICGNSYYTQKLGPFSRLTFDLENGKLTSGENKIPYKITIEIEGETIESNVIVVSMYAAQLDRLIQDN